VQVLAQVFRRLSLNELKNAFDASKRRFFGNLTGLAEPEAFAQRLDQLRRGDWSWR
jgi:hypothetical protein